MKKCNKCEETKNLSEFATRGSGYRTNCKVCCAADTKAWREKNKEHTKEFKRLKYLENSEHIKAKSSKYRLENPEKVKAMKKADYEKNKTRYLGQRKQRYVDNPEPIKAKIAECRKINRGHYNAYGAARHANKLQRTPKWLTKKDKELMKSIYTKAKKLAEQTGNLYDVDHIIPLQGKLVSGLHVPTNLQILTASKNRSKHNEFEP